MPNLIYGIAVNDSDYPINTTVNGKKVRCKYYATWKDMIARAYSKSLHKRYHTYIGTTISEEWLSFMNFKKWMESQDWRGKELDKDIIYPNNKHYSSENCVFITRKLNTFLNMHKYRKRNLPTGVNKTSKGTYIASISIDGKKSKIGEFQSPLFASDMYMRAKADHILKISDQQTDDRIKYGLRRHAEKLKFGLIK